jgi:RNA polymerase sigma factor (sigma-70 family)
MGNIVMHPALYPEEQTLLDEIAAGIEGTGSLEERYKARLLWFARMMGVPSEDASDLAQDVLLIAIREIRSARFRRDSSIITWLDGILKNKIKDFWRAQTRRRSMFISLEPVSTAQSQQQFAERWPARWDQGIDVRGVLNSMPRELRVILLLNESEGLTVEEISRRLKKRPGTVGRKLAESKRVFRERIIEARMDTGTRRKIRAVAGRAQRPILKVS